MANLFDRERNKRTQAKKDRAEKKALRSTEPSSLTEEGVVAFEVGVLAGIQPKVFTVMKDDMFLPGALDREIDPDVASDFVIGDRVFFRRGVEETDPVLLVGREERRSFVTRSRGDWTRVDANLEEHVLSANVDIGIITVSVKDPDFHPRFIDRYLALLQVGNVRPVICLTKTDLTDLQDEILTFYQSINVPIIRTSSLRSEGIEELKNTIRGKTAVFLGQSGVGKSSLLNALIPGIEANTGEVNQKTGKGRHTTTGSSLLKWDTDSYIIDTPGIRSLGIDQLPKKEIRYLFPEFEVLEKPCKFSDCLHMSEPGCAVKQALENKDPMINHFRYESYLKMMEE